MPLPTKHTHELAVGDRLPYSESVVETVTGIEGPDLDQWPDAVVYKVSICRRFKTHAVDTFFMSGRDAVHEVLTDAVCGFRWAEARQPHELPIPEGEHPHVWRTCTLPKDHTDPIDHHDDRVEYQT